MKINAAENQNLSFGTQLKMDKILQKEANRRNNDIKTFNRSFEEFKKELAADENKKDKFIITDIQSGRIDNSDIKKEDNFFFSAHGLLKSKGKTVTGDGNIIIPMDEQDYGANFAEKTITAIKNAYRNAREKLTNSEK